MRKVFVELKVKLVIEVEEGVEISEVIGDMDFTSSTDNSEIVDSKIIEHEIIDSK
jgi:hypothetical protein